MDLDQLKKQLYKKDGEFAGRPVFPEEFAPGQEAEPLRAEPLKWADGQEKNFYFSIKEKRMLWLASAVVVLAVLAISGWFIWRNMKSFDDSGVALDIFGQDRVASGEEINYIVRYKNNSKVAVGSVVLTFSAPAQSMPSDTGSFVKRGDFFTATQNLGQLASGQEGQTEFKVRVLGDKDSQQKFTAKLNYRPSNISSDFGNSADFTSAVISVPLVLSFILPERIVSGQTMNFSLRYLNTSDANFEGAKLKIEYPDGFVFDSALPSPEDGNNIWSLPEIGSREEGNLVIKGTISGNEGDSKIFKAQIGTQTNNGDFVVYSQALSSSRISASPLFVEQSFLDSPDNNVSSGQFLNYKIKYRNTTGIAIGPVFVTIKIDSKVVDISSVSAVNGFFSSSDNLITWNSSSLPALESLDAGEEGILDFSLKVKNNLPVNSFLDKNFTIVTTAKIDSFNVPLALNGTQLAGQSQLTAKVNSKLVLNMKGYYNDRLLPNSGPLPPRVGQKTTYTVYWHVLNSSNDLSNVKVEAYLPSYVSWQGNIFPKDEDIKYDVSSGKVTWQIGKLSAATGFLSPVRQVAFQVGFTPSLGQVGTMAIIMQTPKVAGDDNFTSAQLTATDSELKSDMPDDSAVGEAKGRISQ